MPPNKPQSNYSKRPIKKVRLLKIGPPKTKGLFEEYFYGFLVAIVVISSILGKAGGLTGSDALIMGLWLGGITWFAWQLKRYFKEKPKPAPRRKRVQVVETLPQRTNGPMPPGMKPMIGPQWPLKGAPGPAQVSQAPGQNNNKPAFVYERPTLPDRKPKLPANWPGRPSKKPKQ